MSKPATKSKPAPEKTSAQGGALKTEGRRPRVEKAGSSDAKKPSTLPPPFPAWLRAALLVLMTVLAYQPAWHAGFIWDDDDYVTRNKLLFASDGVWRIWFSFDSPSQYFPLTYTVFRLEYALWGLNPTGYHWVNILLHAANALLVWRLLSRLAVPGAWLGAAIWALHPVQVESVAWITELKNVLMCFFFVLTLLAWVEFIDIKTRRGWRFYALALVLYALALCSKTTACTLPAALLLILWLKDSPVNQRRWAQIIPFIMLGTGMGVLTMWWERYHQGTQGQLFAMGAMDRILVASRAIWFYAGKLIWPVNLTFSYPRWVISTSDPFAYVWLAATAGFVAAIYATKRHVGRSVGVAALFFISTLSPMMGFIMLYTFAFSFVADHYQYVASLGLIALTSAGITVVFDLTGNRKPLLKPVFCCLLLLSLGFLTWRQCRMYSDIETLWRTTIQLNSNSWLAENNLGNALLQKGGVDEAVSHYRQALQIKPDFAEARYNLGNALLQEGKADEAIVQYKQSLQSNPENAEAHYNLGNLLLQKGSGDEAIYHFQQALQIEPDFAEAHYNLGNALFQKGNVDEAISEYQQVLRIKPGFAEAHNNLANALLQKGGVDEAIMHLQVALQINPINAEAHYSLGNALFQKGRDDEAIIQYQQALQIKPNYAEAHNNLGGALLQKGSVSGAISQYQQALQIKPGYTDAQKNLDRLLGTASQTSLLNSNKAIAPTEQSR